MNGEPNPSPQVPVTTLAGIASLSQLLPELPLPSPSTSSSSRSLLFHPRVAEEAQRLLTCQDDTLLTQLAQSLAHTSAQHIELKEQYAGSDSVLDLKSAPPLLQGILCKKPCVFQGPKEGSEGLSMVKDEDEKTVNHNTVPPKASPHLNNISVIRKGPASVSDSGPQVSVKSEPVSNTHTNDSKDKTTLKEEDASSELDKKMKEPVVVLNKLSTEDLRSMGRIPKLIGATGGGHGESGGDRDGMDEKNKKKMDKHDTSQNSASRSTRSGRRDSRKYKEVSSESESEDDKKKPAKYFKNREKEREEKRKKDKADRKRHRTYYDDDDYDPTQTKKKRKGDEESGEEEAYEEDSADEPAPREQQVKRPLKKVYNNKRIERKLVPITEKLTSEELMETNTYQRFNRAIERIFDNTEDLDLNAEIEDDVPQEYLIAKYELSELCAEAAKLKNMGAMATVPPERLVRLLNILEKNIRDGAKVTPIIDDDDEDDDKLWMELVLERILRGMDASLTSMYIITASNMNKRVYLEDVIERCVQFAKFQLSNTIYPSFDPVYRIESKKDGYVGNVKRKRQHNRDVKNRNILGLYNKLHELVGLLADLTHLQPLTDTTVLILSTLGVAPFFVENVSELQLSALRLVTSVFAKYDKHRRLLLDDILASIARLPSSKRSLRTYRLNSDENIQMLTALVLQLIQCMVELPEELGKSKGSQTKSASESEGARESKDSKDSKDSKESKEVKSEGNKLNLNMDRDVLVCNKYETAIRTAVSFLSVFLQKCGSKSEEVNYRPLFENFVQDLLSTVNKPEWPAAELLLSLLGKLLVQNFSNKNIDMSLRVASIDYLGVVAARLRKDAVSSQLKLDTIDQIIGEIREEENKNVTFIEDISSHNSPAENGTITTSSKKKNKKKGGGSGSSPVKDEAYIDPEEERTRFLQRVLLDWLAVNSESEQALLHARHFYIAQWYRDSNSEIRRQKQGPQVSPSKQKKKKRRNRKDDSGDEESTENETDDENERQNPENEALIAEVTRLAEKRKSFLLTKIPALPPATPGAKTQILQTHLDYENAELITRYLAAKRPFSQSFDVYLMQILRVLTESAIAVRTKAMKCLTMVVEADPSVLARSDMQLGVNHSFLDHSTSVREAAVDLVGKFVLSRPELIDKYYDMISARILDTGVSVRKRVIKIMKDICLECPQFPKIPEICVKMIRRVNDEEGIKKLVQEVFQNMWFTPVRERPQLDTEGLLRKVNNITDVVVACKDTGLDWFEQLLQSMFKPKEDKDDVTKVNLEPPKTLMTACKQIVDCLVEHILVLEESGLKQQSEETTPVSKGTSHRLVACLTTLYLFAKIRPQLLVSHAITIQPYLAVKCQTQGDYAIIANVARTLELVVPLMEHPSETFLSQLEEDAVKLILQHDKTVITSCLALLGSIVNNVTKNFRLIKDCFNKYHSFIYDYKTLHMENPDNSKLENFKPFFRRALYTVGLLLRHFDLREKEVRCGLPEDIADQVFDTLMYFMMLSDMNLRYCTLQAIGSVCIRHYELMMGIRLKNLYHELLLDPTVNVQLRIQTLLNIETYLQEEEIRMIRQDQEWAKRKTKENLKEMCDVQSGMASAIIQIYLKQVLESLVHGSINVRHAALKVIQLILAQGLVHPVQIVPYLVCMSTDAEEMVAHPADKQLQDIEKKYPGFIQMKAMQGFRLSYKLQSIIQSSPPTRGRRVKEGEIPSALNGFLYSIMRSTKQQRRAIALSLMKQFDEQARTSLAEMLYIADNLAYFPYQVVDEPLFIVHHIDVMISVTGANLLQSFKESLLPPPNVEIKIDPETGRPLYLDDDDDDDCASLYSRLPQDLTPLVEYITASQGCLLLLMLKGHLKEVYGITDSKINQYSPSDTSKQYEKSVSRKSNAKFNPKATLQQLKEHTKEDPSNFDESQKQELINKYLDFKALMLKIDPDDDDENSDGGFSPNKSANPHNAAHPTVPSARLNQSGSEVQLLPGTHDGWKDHPDGCVNTGGVEGGGNATPPLQQAAPIQTLTIKASQITTPSRDHRHHRSHRSSHRSASSHKKHKKKKKRKRISDSEEEESEHSDPDFLV